MMAEKKRQVSVTRPFTSWYGDVVFFIDESRKASVSIRRFSDGPDVDGKTWLTDLYVHPDYRKQGIATRLIHAAKHYCHRHHIEAVYLWTERENIAFYEKRGFQNVHQSKQGTDGQVFYQMMATTQENDNINNLHKQQHETNRSKG